MLSIMELQRHPVPGDLPFRRGGETHKKTVMVIEESPFLRHIIEDELTSLGYRVLMAANPASPDFSPKLRLADAAIISFHRHQGSGWDIFNRLKATHADLPVLLYTMEDRPSVGMKAITEALAEVFSAGDQTTMAS
jgi:DNA-binding NtrC family response regulator